jgi:hypothetical protein
MNNLMQIEADFLTSQSEVNFRTVWNLQSQVSDAKKSKFDKSLKLAKLVSQSLDWFKKPETKAELQEAGIEWTNAEVFFNRVYGWQKSFGHKMVKAGKLETSLVSKFKRQCTQLENNGEDAIRSIEALLKFAKAEENGEEAEAPTRAKTLFSLSIAKDGINGESGFSLRVTEDGNITESGEVVLTTEISDMITNLSRLIQTQVNQLNGY